LPAVNARLGVLAMLGSVAIYGANFPLSRLGTQQGLSPYDLAALRYAISGVLLLPVFVRAGFSTCAGVGWRRGAVLAILSGVPMALIMNTGLKYAPAGHGAALAPGMVTVIGAVGSYLLFRVRPSRFGLFGIGITLLGLACIAAAGTASGSPNVMLGDGLFLANGMLWGFYPLLLQRWQVGGMVSTAIVSVLSLPYIPIYLVLLHPGLTQIDPGVLAFHAVNQGIFNMILGLWLWGSAVRILGAARAQRFPPLIPVCGTLLAIPILGEVPGPLQALGVALIVTGLALAAFGAQLVARLRASTRR
jgi:drug/metabolite transporter (DMT)-like permease